MTVYALLDFDGYICKAFYAANSKKGSDKNANEILESLYWSAIEKTANYFNVRKDEVMPLLFVSTHSWKKDVFPTYKVNRKKNDELGRFRDEIISSDDDIIKIEQLEADEVLIMMNGYLEFHNKKTVIFSDDKDLKYYANLYCKINLCEKIVELGRLENTLDRYTQMLAGDKEDNITGIPNIGMVKGKKILKEFLENSSGGRYNIPILNDIVSIYKNNSVSFQDCIEQLALIIPTSYFTCKIDLMITLCESVLNGESHLLDDSIIQEIIDNSLKRIENEVTSVYG